MSARNDTGEVPWYRHRWPWILMLGPFVVLVAGAVTIYLSLISNDGLVADDYYKLGLEVNQMSARDREAAALGLHAQLMQSESGGGLRLLLRANANVELPSRLKATFSHPTRAGVDREILLRAEGGAYTGSAGQRLAGRWYVAVEDDDKRWRLTGLWNLDTTPVLELNGPAEAAR